MFLRPVGQAIRKRREYINGVVSGYAAYQAEAKTLREQAEGIRAQARREAELHLAKARADASNEAAAIAAKYATQAQTIVEEAQRNADSELNRARAGEERLVKQLADLMVERSLGNGRVNQNDFYMNIAVWSQVVSAVLFIARAGVALVQVHSAGHFGGAGSRRTSRSPKPSATATRPKAMLDLLRNDIESAGHDAEAIKTRVDAQAARECERHRRTMRARPASTACAARRRVSPECSRRRATGFATRCSIKALARAREEAATRVDDALDARLVDRFAASLGASEMVNEKLARRYALAIFSLASDGGNADAVGDDLATIATAIGGTRPRGISSLRRWSTVSERARTRGNVRGRA